MLVFHIFRSRIVLVINGQDIYHGAKASKTSYRCKKVCYCNSNDTGRLYIAFLVILYSLQNGTADEEQLKYWGYLEDAHYHIEVVGNDSWLDTKILYLTVSLIIFIILHLGRVVDDACNYNDCRADIEDCQWDKLEFALLYHDIKNVVRDEAEQSTVQTNYHYLTCEENLFLGIS